MFDNLFDPEVYKAAIVMLTRSVPKSRYLDTTTYSFNTDALVYLDEIGIDTAIGEGVEELALNRLSESQIKILLANGYIVHESNIYAFGRFLLHKFIEATFLLESADIERRSILNTLKSMVGTQDTFDQEQKVLK